MAFTQASQSSLEELSSSFLHVIVGVLGLGISPLSVDYPQCNVT